MYFFLWKGIPEEVSERAAMAVVITLAIIMRILNLIIIFSSPYSLPVQVLMMWDLIFVCVLFVSMGGV